MKRKVMEQSVLLVSIVKWIVLASCTGILVGASTAVFLKLLNGGIWLTSRLPYFFLLMPFAFLASTLLVKYLAPDARGHGTEKIIEAVHRRSGKIKLAVVPVKLLATVVTIACGGSAGKEGPAAQIGAALCSGFADLFRFDNKDRKKLVICGISAGFATVFGTPIAGAIFGVEVLYVGGLLYDVLLPSFIAGMVGYHVSSLMGTTYFHHPLSFVPSFTSLFFLKVCLGGIFFGLCSILLIESLTYFGKIARAIKVREEWKAFAAGVVLILLTLVFSTQYLGLGLDTIEQALQGHNPPWYAFILKVIFTSITLGFGGSGGIITPIFFVGSTAGNLFGQIPGFGSAIFAAIGMVSLIAGAANTPIAASIMAVEFFGPQVAPFAAVSCVISFLMTGHRSVYPSQILSMSKSSSLSVEPGKEMRQIDGVQYEEREKSLTGIILKGIRKITGNR
ncbi:MAG TPA: chloride channel protein [Syntrophorhabdaceae bacterium]|nr:chloride channel protein [Syntrophorhabdaceae bacterium]